MGDRLEGLRVLTEGAAFLPGREGGSPWQRQWVPCEGTADNCKTSRINSPIQCAGFHDPLELSEELPEVLGEKPDYPVVVE